MRDKQQHAQRPAARTHAPGVALRDGWGATWYAPAPCGLVHTRLARGGLRAPVSVMDLNVRSCPVAAWQWSNLPITVARPPPIVSYAGATRRTDADANARVRHSTCRVSCEDRSWRRRGRGDMKGFPNRETGPLLRPQSVYARWRADEWARRHIA